MAQARRKRMTALLTAVLLLAGLLPIAADSPDSPEPRTAKGEQRYAASSFQFDGDAVYDEAEQALKVSGSARLRLSLRTEQVGNYTMALEYRLDAQGGKPLELQLLVNGGAPAAYELPRVYRDVTDGTFERDEQGNDIRPAQETVSDYVMGTLRQADYRAAQSYCPALREGDNTVELQLTDQRVSIRCLVLSKPVALTPYQKPAGFQESGETIDIEAEYPLCKSDSLLYPLADRTSRPTRRIIMRRYASTRSAAVTGKRRGNGLRGKYRWRRRAIIPSAFGSGRILPAVCRAFAGYT